MLLDSPPGSDDEASMSLDPRGLRHASRAPSPTPSVASGFGDPDEEGDFVGEGMDAVAELRSFGAGTSKGKKSGSARGLSRSSTLPVGQFALGKGPGGGKAAQKVRSEREGTVLPTLGEDDGVQGVSGPVETRNKNVSRRCCRGV